jgi:hypothetical protein
MTTLWDSVARGSRWISPVTGRKPGGGSTAVRGIQGLAIGSPPDAGSVKPRPTWKDGFDRELAVRQTTGGSEMTRLEPEELGWMLAGAGTIVAVASSSRLTARGTGGCDGSCGSASGIRR